MSGTDLTSAMEAAVARMERNRGGGTALAHAPSPRPVVALAIVPDTGEALLPSAVDLPSMPEDIADAMAVARATASGATIAAPAPVRASAAHHAMRVERLLLPLADPDLIREWLGRWAPHCRRQNGEDYEGRERAILLAVSDLPAIAFCGETAALAAREPRFEWLPTPQAVSALLDAWLAPYRTALEAARRVAAARDPEPAAREAAGPDAARLTPAQEAERKAAVAKTMEGFREAMAAAREANARGMGNGGRPKPRYVTPLELGIQMLNELRQGVAPAIEPAMRTRFAAHLRKNPDVAEALEAEMERAGVAA